MSIFAYKFPDSYYPGSHLYVVDKQAYSYTPGGDGLGVELAAVRGYPWAMRKWKRQYDYNIMFSHNVPFIDRIR